MLSRCVQPNLARNTTRALLALQTSNPSVSRNTEIRLIQNHCFAVRYSRATSSCSSKSFALSANTIPQQPRLLQIDITYARLPRQLAIGSFVIGQTHCLPNLRASRVACLRPSFDLRDGVSVFLQGLTEAKTQQEAPNAGTSQTPCNMVWNVPFIGRDPHPKRR